MSTNGFITQWGVPILANIWMASIPTISRRSRNIVSAIFFLIAGCILLFPPKARADLGDIAHHVASAMAGEETHTDEDSDDD